MAFITIWRILATCLIISQAETPYELYSIGAQYELDGNVFKAIEYYERARMLGPESPEIFIALANAYYKIRQFDAGIAVAQQGTQLFQEDIDLLITGAVGYIGKGDLQSAIPYYKRARELKPDNIDTYFGLSVLYEGIGALDTASQILENMPDTLKSADVYVRLGTLAGKEDNHTTAINLYQKAYSMDTTNIPALLGIGTAYDLQRNPDSSIYYYEKALQDDSLLTTVGKRLIELYGDVEDYQKLAAMARRILSIDYTDGYIRRNLGYALYQIGMLEPALMEFLISAGLEADDSYSRFHAGRIYLEMGEHDAALDEIEKAIDIDPDFVELWVYLGFVAIETQDFETAEFAFTEAAYRGADVVQVYYLLGVISEMQEHFEPAYFYYHKSLKEDAENLATLEALAHLCDRIERKGEAVATFEKIIRADSINATALNYVGYWYADRDEKLDYALELIERAIEQEPDNGYFIDSRGWVFYRMERYDEALKDLERASELVDDAVIFEHMGDVYLEFDDIEKARVAYEKGLEIEPENRIIRGKLEKLKE
jgi:tetratricopeptide (TPR) repeat protein